mmetsp:Transcript_98714/g.166172  ORF Transcript_98714/g.166172 Transcript_98714/m.166172 type:complete len:232 (-) Transcript_98714:254-949(-)
MRAPLFNIVLPHSTGHTHTHRHPHDTMPPPSFQVPNFLPPGHSWGRTTANNKPVPHQIINSAPQEPKSLGTALLKHEIHLWPMAPPVGHQPPRLLRPLQWAESSQCRSSWALAWASDCWTSSPRLGRSPLRENPPSPRGRSIASEAQRRDLPAPAPPEAGMTRSRRCVCSKKRDGFAVQPCRSPLVQPPRFGRPFLCTCHPSLRRPCPAAGPPLTAHLLFPYHHLQHPVLH